MHLEWCNDDAHAYLLKSLRDVWEIINLFTFMYVYKRYSVIKCTQRQTRQHSTGGFI